MNNTKYSIVYAVIQPEINEQLSVGLIVMDGDRSEYRYSEKKLRALKEIYQPKEYQVFERIITNLAHDKTITTPQGISYLNRYSNNLMTFSQLEDINLPMNTESTNWMFHHFVDKTA